MQLTALNETECMGVEGNEREVFFGVGRVVRELREKASAGSD